MLNKYFKRHHDKLYVVFRVIIGFLFFVHGGQKLFGLFGSKMVAPMFSLLWTAGLIETIAGPLIALGLFARLAAVLGGIDMIGALGIVHFPKSILPYANGGELALLYLAAFFVVIIYGNGKASLEKVLLKKEHF